MHVYSNKPDTVNDYVEIVAVRAHLRDRVSGKNIVGWSVSTNVFSHDPKYDDLVGLNKNFYLDDTLQVQEYIKAIARQYGLAYDKGNTHRRKLWSV